MALEREIDFFNKNLESWLEHFENKFALVYQDKLIGTFTKETEAFKCGLDDCGDVDFLIRLIVKTQPVVIF